MDFIDCEDCGVAYELFVKVLSDDERRTSRREIASW